MFLAQHIRFLKQAFDSLISLRLKSASKIKRFLSYEAADLITFKTLRFSIVRLVI